MTDNPNTCQPCREYFAKFSCGAMTHGECDCPRCQGYCDCYKAEAEAIIDGDPDCAACRDGLPHGPEHVPDDDTVPCTTCGTDTADWSFGKPMGCGFCDDTVFCGQTCVDAHDRNAHPDAPRSITDIKVILMDDAAVCDLIERVVTIARRAATTDAEREDCDRLEDFAVNELGEK